MFRNIFSQGKYQPQKSAQEVTTGWIKYQINRILLPMGG